MENNITSAVEEMVGMEMAEELVEFVENCSQGDLGKLYEFMMQINRGEV